ncbi:hypothetical protein ACQV2B_02725 [Pantoea allii]|uniref:hypothetical protein n=1 Tax=Pantoea allii TaxID=574096 RepID=UPI003D31D244
MISDERIDAVAKMKTHPMVFPPTHDECIAMTKELQAYRKGFSEPFGYVHRLYETMETGVVSKDHEAYKGLASHFPLYRKPTIPS